MHKNSLNPQHEDKKDHSTIGEEKNICPSTFWDLKGHKSNLYWYFLDAKQRQQQLEPCLFDTHESSSFGTQLNKLLYGISEEVK